MAPADDLTGARLGWYTDGLPDEISPERPVLLEVSEEDVLVTCMLKHDEPLADYFHAPLRSPTPLLDPVTPTTGIFSGAGGDVALAGGRYLPGTLASGASTGHIRFRYAVHGGENLAYETIDGLKSRTQGMGEWFDLPHVDWDFVRDADGTVDGLHLTARSQKSRPLASRLNLTLETSFSGVPIEHGMTVRTWPSLGTTGAEPLPWEEHLKVHRFVADLMSIAAGTEVGFEEVWVNRQDDPATAHAGNPLGEKWSRATVPGLARPRDGGSPLRFLFTARDLSEEFAERFLELDDGLFHRALDHVRGVFRARHDFLETRFSLGAMAVEHLGHAIGVEARAWTPKDRPSYAAKAGQLANAVPGVVGHDWHERMAQLNRQLKHPDHEEPDPTELRDSLYETRFALRAWVALRLGMRHELLLDRLGSDAKWRRLKARSEELAGE